MTAAANIERHLEELHLLQCSLLSGERLTFAEPLSGAGGWKELLDSYSEGALDWTSYPPIPPTLYPARLRVLSEGVPMCFDIELPSEYPKVAPVVLVRGDEITRSEHERWQSIVQDKFREVEDSDYPLYDLISAHLLPLLHDARFVVAPEPPTQHVQASAAVEPAEKHHALLTSHHLISPTKRRNLQSWSSQQDITGFAKVGYPGVIYCEGIKDQVEEFVAKIRAMQWLALRLRFIEPVPKRENEPLQAAKRTWSEFEKVGEVVGEMKRLGRVKYVVEMGIGSSAKG